MLSIDDRGPWPACPAPFNLAAHVLAAGSALPDKIALMILRPAGAERWSFGRLEAAVRGCGAGLLARGLQPGDQVLMRLGNGVAFPILFLGALAAGLVPVATNAALTGTEISRMCGRISPRLIVAEPGVALPDPLPCPVIDADEMRAMERLAPCAWHLGDPDRPGYVVFTSGTTGAAQAVCHAHRAIWARGMMRGGWEGFDPEDRVLHAGAFNWTYTLGTGLLDPWAVGATALVPGAGVAVAQLPLMLRRFDATVFAAVPGVYRQMMRAGLPALPRLKRALSAGEAMEPGLRAAWVAATGRPLHEAFGLSECSTFVSGCDASPAPEGATGYAQKGRRVAVVDGAGLPVPRGEAGILAVSRGDPGLMLGYLGDDAATAARLAGDWFLTGDRAVMAADGAIHYLGRVDDQMNAGGYRVSPLEVEAAFAGVAGLAEVAVTEVEVAPGTRVIGCFHVGSAAEADLRQSAETRLAPWKQPRIYRNLAELPRNANGKLNRKALSALKEPR